ncbi:arginine repressor, partial [Vibrio cholerae]|nr:ArgR family transcriptional regulator [Vibrio cholerae O1]
LKRQTMIKRLVTENEIHTQSELLALLEKENIHTTQATISRDIRELNLNKVERVAFLLVVHTLPDNATLFSAVLDEVS